MSWRISQLVVGVGLVVVVALPLSCSEVLGLGDLHARSQSDAAAADDGATGDDAGGGDDAAGGDAGPPMPPLTRPVAFVPKGSMIEGRYGFGYAVNGNTIYVANGAGTASSFLTSMEQYSSTDNTWRSLVVTPALIGKRYGNMVYGSMGNKLYLLNGALQSGTNAAVEVVDIGAKTVTVLGAPNPYPAYFASAIYYQNKIYVFGGINSARVSEYDIARATWTAMPDMHEAKSSMAVAVVADTVYTFGGLTSSGTSKRIDAFNLGTKTWNPQPIGQMADGASAFSAAVYGRYIWLAGDYNNLTRTGVYDTQGQAYWPLTSNLEGRRHAGAGVISGSWFVFGGTQATSGSYLGTTFAFDFVAAGVAQ